MTIDYEQFKKTEIKVGRIGRAEKMLNADKLLVLKVNFGQEDRVIVSGIAPYFPDPSVLEGRQCAFVTNLEPRLIRGVESQGMIMAAHDEAGNFSLLEVDNRLAPGSLIN